MRRGGDGNQRLRNLWDVVSNLARALTDARDQLIGLVTFPSARRLNRGIPQHEKQIVSHVNHGFEQSDALVRYQGGGPSYRKKFPIPGSKHVKSIHRQHARGHVAFGAHSEFKPRPPCTKPPKGTSVSSSSGSRGKKKKECRLGSTWIPSPSACRSTPRRELIILSISASYLINLLRVRIRILAKKTLVVVPPLLTANGTASARITQLC